jgi:hypothetical protein
MSRFSARAEVVALRVHPVHRELRVVPVDQRVVEADAQSRRPARLDERADQVLAVRRTGDRVVRHRRVPPAEALVVLGGEHGVPHPGGTGGPRPGDRVVQVGLEVVEVRLVVLGGQPLVVLDPLVPRGQCVQAEVDEHAESPVRKRSSCAVI